jgi:hypothetical protein
MPVSLSPAVAPKNKIQIGCNIRQLPQFVNVSFSDKSRQGSESSLYEPPLVSARPSQNSCRIERRLMRMFRLNTSLWHGFAIWDREDYLWQTCFGYLLRLIFFSSTILPTSYLYPLDWVPVAF